MSDASGLLSGMLQKRLSDAALLGRLKRELAKPRVVNSARKNGMEKMPSVMKRELIEIRQEWVCNRCGYEFYNPGCILDGLTLVEIVLHVKKMREQAFANHICFSLSEKLDSGKAPKRQK